MSTFKIISGSIEVTFIVMLMVYCRSYVIFRDRISSTKRRQKEWHATEATRAMRPELNLVSEEPRNIKIVTRFWETAHLALP